MALAAVGSLAAAPPANADIGRANLDGSGADPSFVATPCPDYEISSCHGVAVDGEHIYWSSDYDEALDEAGAIGRANLDGSGVVQRFIETPDPAGLALDGEHIYWGNFGFQSIGRANLDGSGVTQTFIHSRAAGSLAVDGEHIYWIDVGMEKFPGSIGRANLDGSGVEIVLPDIGAGAGLAVDSEHIYWGSDSAIGRANLDGSGVDPSFITTPADPSGVAVDGEHIYWSNFHAGTIGRANLDGSEVDPEFITDARCVTGVVVDSGYVYWNNEGDCADLTATVTVRGKRLRLEGRHVAVRLAVPASEDSPPVSGSVRLKTRKRIRYRGDRRRVTLAEARVKVWAAPGKRSVVLRLSKKARLIRNKSRARKVRAIAEVSDQAGNETRATKRMRVKVGG